MPDPCCVCQQPDSIPACYWAKCPIWIMNCITSIFATTCFIKFALSLLLQSFGVEHTCCEMCYYEKSSFIKNGFHLYLWWCLFAAGLLLSLKNAYFSWSIWFCYT